MRSIEERNAHEARIREAAKPVTWWDALGWAGGAIFSTVAGPLGVRHDAEWARWSPWPQLLGFLFAVGFLCAFVGAYRGVRNGWTKGQAGDAGTKLGCWVFGAPIGLATIVALGSWVHSCVGESLAGTPWWAAVIIVLLVILVLK